MGQGFFGAGITQFVFSGDSTAKVVNDGSLTVGANATANGGDEARADAEVDFGILQICDRLDQSGHQLG